MKMFGRRYVWIVVLCSAETWTVRKEEMKCLERSKTRLWRKMPVIDWQGRVTDAEVLRRIDDNRNIMRTIR